MYFNYKTSVMMTAALMISASAIGPIIELPPDYDQASPWKQLARLGLKNLTETDCQRTCIAGEPRRVCLYTFILENYAAMGTACGNCSHGVLKDCFRPQCIPADGYERGVNSINRMIPGPGIHICKNDVLVVNVKNKMPGTGATIHWHGWLQKHNQWMDGVPYVTQCPIGGNTFTYVSPAQEAGTYFYHGHTGLHKANGHYGNLIVREPRSEESWSTEIYDLDLPEHAIMISDWMHYTAEMFYPGLPSLLPGNRPSTLLINGLGWYSYKSKNDKPLKLPHPLATFHVERNRRYRFRIINGNSMIWPVLVQIEDHNMTLIATDGNPVKPVVNDGLMISAGERFDVVIDTSNVTPEKNSFWIHFRNLDSGGVDQYAVLSYGTNVSHLGIIPQGRRPTMKNPLPNNTIVNDPAAECGASPKRLCISDLRAIGREKDEGILRAEPDVRLFVPFGFRNYKNVDKFHEEGNYQRFMNIQGNLIQLGTMSNITFESPSTPSLFSRGSGDPGFCNADNLPARCKGGKNNSITRHCTCPHFVTVKENDIVEMTLVNYDIDADTGVDHPIHLHGYDFYVARMGLNIVGPEGRTVDKVRRILSQQADAASKTSRFVPASKDTVNVPRKGFAIVRFRANNPGDWFMHCHFEWHSNVGMAMVLRVLGPIAEKPPGFPTCGNFDPLRLTDV